MNDSRFFKRECLLIDFTSLEKVMQDIEKDSSIQIERDYPVLACFSTEQDCGYDEVYISERLEGYLNTKIQKCFAFMDLEEVYFILADE